MKIRYNIIPVRSVIYLLISTVIVASVILFVLYPYYKSLNNLDMEIAGFKQRIRTQKELLPLYTKLLEKSEMSAPDKFSLPEKSSLPKNNIDLIPSIFKGLARKSGSVKLIV